MKLVIVSVFALVGLVAACGPAATRSPPAGPSNSATPAATAPVPATPTAPAPPGPDPALVTRGEELYQAKACRQCHSVDGANGIGPTMKGYFGSTVTLEDGTTVTGDDTRFIAAFDAPAPLKGFQPTMPIYGDQLQPEDRSALAAFVKSLK